LVQSFPTRRTYDGRVTFSKGESPTGAVRRGRRPPPWQRALIDGRISSLGVPSPRRIDDKQNALAAVALARALDHEAT
jgi:hypothetical protein